MSNRKSEILTFEKAEAAYLLDDLSAGKYNILYSDTTHLEEEEWKPIASVQINNSPDERQVVGGYTFQIDFGTQPPDDKEKRVLCDQIALALVRTGLLRPLLDNETWKDIIQLKQCRGIVLVPFHWHLFPMIVF